MNTSETQTLENDLQQISELQKRAVQFAESGMNEEALEAAMICIGLQEEVAPNNLLLRAKLVQNTSRILLYTGDVEQAEAIANEGLGLLRGLSEATSDDIAHALLNLSSILYTKRDFDNASVVLIDALNIWAEEKGRMSAEVADCLSNLGRLREEQGKLEEALDFHQQAIDVKKNVFGDHEQTAFSQMNLGLALILTENFSAAEVSLKAALDCCDRIGKIDSELAKACIENLKLCKEKQ